MPFSNVETQLYYTTCVKLNLMYAVFNHAMYNLTTQSGVSYYVMDVQHLLYPIVRSVSPIPDRFNIDCRVIAEPTAVYHGTLNLCMETSISVECPIFCFHTTPLSCQSVQKLKIHEQTPQYIDTARLFTTLYCMVILEKSSFCTL